jgi:septal ring factor EnvC (AmiA/AmiB activator)
MAKLQTIAERVESAQVDYEHYVDALSREERIDVDAAVATCGIVGSSFKAMQADAVERRQWLLDKAEYDRVTDPKRMVDCRAEIDGAKQDIEDVRAKIAKFDPALKAAHDRLALANAQLVQINREQNDVRSRLAHIRHGKTKQQMREEAEERLGPGKKYNVGGGRTNGAI